MSDQPLCRRCDSPIKASDRFAKIPTPNVMDEDAAVFAHEACLQLGRKDEVGYTPDDGYAGTFNEDEDGEWEWDGDMVAQRP